MIRPVEGEWHYGVMSRYGFVPETKSAEGLVRQYRYLRPSDGRAIVVATGYHADHWNDETSGAGGYWSTLENHLMEISP